MRWLPYGLILVGLFRLAIAAEAAYYGRFEASRHHLHGLRRDEAWEMLRNRMRYACLEGGCWVVGGLLLLGFLRSVDRVTPFSTGYKPGKAVYELEEELRRKEESKGD